MTSRAHILVLNHDGRPLLEECLPSVVASARAAATRCRVTVIDNESTDDSADFVRRQWPELGWMPLENRVLVSFNEAMRRVSEPVVLLLNNDVKLDAGCVDRLIEPFQRDRDCFITTPLCWTFDGRPEAARNEFQFRRGFVTTIRSAVCGEFSTTASGGAVMAVSREKFLRLGGFDPLFLPGRFEDLDLAFRGWLAGWKAYHVPDAVAYHKGSATFGPQLGPRGGQELDVRNALLFAWKNLREPRHVATHFAFLALRLLRAVVTGHGPFLRGCANAVRRLPQVAHARAASAPRVRSERELFEMLGAIGAAGTRS